MLKESRKNGSRRASAWAALLVCTIALVPATGYGQDEESITILKRMGTAFASVAEKVSPGVVGVRAERRVARRSMQQMPFGDPFGEDFFEYFFRRRGPQDPPEDQESPGRGRLQRAQGSGFIISEDGYILTNNHVVAEAERVRVQLNGDQMVDAEVVGTDPESDIAVLKIDTEKDLTPVALGDSQALQVGEWVLAIGDPMGLEHTVTAGIVSATGRSGLNIATYENFIQTDAAINMGNSGGPLVNLNGEAVGINTAILGPGGGNIGIGFAIPINMARQVAEQLIEGGAVERGYLGVIPQDITQDLADAFGLDEAEGVVISQVTEDSAAAEGGVETGDVVLEFEGVDVESAAQFRNLVAAQRPGARVEMVVLRDGRRRTLTITLRKRPSIEELRGQIRGRQEQEQSQRLGITIQNMTEELAERFGFDDADGVIITQVRPNTVAAEKGLRAGMVIKQINREQVNSVDEARDLINESIEEEESILMLVTDGQASQFVVLKPPFD